MIFAHAITLTSEFLNFCTAPEPRAERDRASGITKFENEVLMLKHGRNEWELLTKCEKLEQA